MAGAMASSMRSSTRARIQAWRAMLVHSSLTSQQISRPLGTRPRAMHIADVPVKVPTSTANAVSARGG